MKTILIADDDSAVRTMLRIVLSTEGYETLEAENGMAAFSVASEHHPDLIISDVMMENMNGFMLYEMLRKEPATRSIPLILITGVAQDIGAWGSESDINYLQKPVSTKRILAAVKSRLQRPPAVDRVSPGQG